MYIHENLKRLRRARDLTQEELANILGVSFQSVSKWERGECYPDITMLPSLANFFEISVDELMGMEKMRDERRMADLYRLAHGHEQRGEFAEAIALYRRGLREIPNEYGLLSELALAIALDGASTAELVAEAISCAERVLAGCTREKVRATTRITLCYLYERGGMHERAIELAKTLPHFWETRELTVAALSADTQRVELTRKAAAMIIATLCGRIDAALEAEVCAPKIIALGAGECGADIAEQLERIGRFIAG